MRLAKTLLVILVTTAVSTTANSKCDGVGVGENLWLFASSQKSRLVPWTSCVTSWYDEISDYSYESNSCKIGKQCGHYTQVVWDASREIGCGVAQYQANGMWKQVVACNYNPPGNYPRRPYSLGQKGSSCETTVTKPESGVGWKLDKTKLCEICYKSCDTDCKCFACKVGKLDSQTCSCDGSNNKKSISCDKMQSDDLLSNSASRGIFHWIDCLLLLSITLRMI